MTASPTTYFYDFSALHPQTQEWVTACAEYTITNLGPGGWEGGEVEVLQVWLEPDGQNISPTDEEIETLEEKIFQAHDFEDHSHDR